ncbi:MAG: inverse autotransporter beta domain-containing protein, partial [Planctomycetaceae bacterium]
MTGQNLSRLATRFRQNLGLFVAMAAIGLTNTSVLAQSYSYAPPQVYGSGPSGSVSGNVVNYDGRGMGVMLRGGHAAGNAIGREESISYISGMPYATFGETMLFGDARLARANRGGLAWSFGAGFRHYFSDVDAVFGLNGYLDNDQLVDDFQSWGVGAELLADQWEWRGNMYKPFGDSRFQTSVEAADGSVQFSGNQILFDRVRNFATALEGYDTEIGFLLPGRIAQERQIRAFGGGYVYETDARDAVGWKARLQAQPMEFLELGLQVSNDRLFDTSLVFNVAVQLGGFRENRPSRSARYRMAEPVRRNISIATGDVAVTEEDVPVLGADGAPVTVAHVSSLVGRAVGVGSVDDPFQTIQQGQFAGSDIVFVHAGSRFDVPGENSVLMTPGQRILGEGLLRGRPVAATHLVDIPEIGLTALPSAPSFFADSTLSQPIISGANPIGVTLANDVEFSGFIVENVTQDAVFGDGVENV